MFTVVAASNFNLKCFYMLLFAQADNEKGGQVLVAQTSPVSQTPKVQGFGQSPCPIVSDFARGSLSVMHPL